MTRYLTGWALIAAMVATPPSLWSLILLIAAIWVLCPPLADWFDGVDR